MLEATGRSGADGGIDIRGVEAPGNDNIDENRESEADTLLTRTAEDRTWVFQCKREKNLGLAKVRKAVQQAVSSFSQPPWGLVLAASCDVSARARATFRDSTLASGVREAALWARSELEDMLFQAKNDRLLFAYFGISLQTTRRSLGATLRAEIAKKRQLAAMIEEGSTGDGRLVLIRDPSDSRYPHAPTPWEHPERTAGKDPPLWFAAWATHVRDPGHLTLLDSEHHAVITPDGQHWDALLDFDISKHRAHTELCIAGAWQDEGQPIIPPELHAALERVAPDYRPATLRVLRTIPYDRILAVDPIGDGYFPIPHILVESNHKRRLCSDSYAQLAIGLTIVALAPLADNRLSIFPRRHS